MCNHLACLLNPGFVTPAAHPAPDDEMTEALREAIARVGQAEAALHALQKEQHDIIRFSTGDFKWGDDDVFFSFAGRCVAAEAEDRAPT